MVKHNTLLSRPKRILLSKGHLEKLSIYLDPGVVVKRKNALILTD